MRTTATAKIFILPALGFALNAAVTSTGFAQVGSFGTSTTLEPPPRSATQTTPPKTADTALTLGSWQVYPTMFGGVIYDTNINQAATGAQSSYGFRIAPSIAANRDDGINRTTAYGMVDARIYTRQSGNNSDVVSAKVGVANKYQPVADWIFGAGADFTRQSNLFTTFGVDRSLKTFNPTGNGLSPTANATPYNQTSGNLSAQKNFDKAFVLVQGSVVNMSFDDSNTSTTSPNGTTFNGSLRGGVWFTPVFYGFAEAGADHRNFSNRSLSSNGYRVTGGVGTEQVGLLRGEIFGGYQEEDFKGIANTGSAVFGLRGEYLPLKELSIHASVDQSIGASQLVNTPTSSRVTTALASVDYTIARQWTAAGRAGYIHTEFVSNARRDDAWTVGATLSYSIVRNFDATIDFQHLELKSNAAAQSFARDVATLGLTYRY